MFKNERRTSLWSLCKWQVCIITFPATMLCVWQMFILALQRQWTASQPRPRGVSCQYIAQATRIWIVPVLDSCNEHLLVITLLHEYNSNSCNNDVMTWKRFPNYWTFLLEPTGHKEPVICFDVSFDLAWMGCWTSSRVVGYLRRCDAHVTSF